MYSALLLLIRNAQEDILALMSGQVRNKNKKSSFCHFNYGGISLTFDNFSFLFFLLFLAVWVADTVQHTLYSIRFQYDSSKINNQIIIMKITHSVLFLFIVYYIAKNRVVMV